MARVALLAIIAAVFVAGATAQSEQCTVCVDLIGAVERELQNNATQTDVVKLLDKICSALSGFSTTCDAIVSAGIPTVVDWINEHENATVVCGLLRLCTSEAAVIVPAELPRPVAGSSLECQACQGGIQFIEHWLADNQTEAWIEKELEATVCKFVPYIESTCDAIAVNGVPKVINWINTHESPAAVCQQLKVCTSARKPSRPIISVVSKTFVAA